MTKYRDAAKPRHPYTGSIIANQLAHFSINATDLDRARAFYSGVFGWTFQAYGPPGFFMIQFPDATPRVLFGSLQQRREIVAGVPLHAPECTFAVDDIEDSARRIEAHGGSIVMPICALAGVGRLLFFRDPEGNLAGAMQYGAA